MNWPRAEPWTRFIPWLYLVIIVLFSVVSPYKYTYRLNLPIHHIRISTLSLSLSLRQTLLDDNKASRLTWPIRYNVALGIASALNFLHCRDAAHPAYHRDVKSANIALSSDLTAKLIDCGLAKYIPPDAIGGHTAFTKSGARFGTPGYQCAHYLRDGRFDAKSEVFSFGVVLAELLCGCLQRNDEREQLRRVVIELEDGELDGVEPDMRIEASAVGRVTESWMDLIKRCICSHKKRIADMRTVLRELRKMKELSCEAMLADVQEQLRAAQLQQAVAEQQRTKEEQERSRVCLVCYDDGTLDRGLECDAGHFICKDCFAGDNLRHQLSAEQRGVFIQNDAKLMCEFCIPPQPFSDQRVAMLLDEECFKKYQSAKEEVVEVKVCKREEEKFQSQLQQMREEIEKAAQGNVREQAVMRHRLEIAESILTLKCPQCRAAIFDFEGCFAITCHSCTTHFCGWCLDDFGLGRHGDADAHRHVSSCGHAPPRRRGGVYGQLKEFNEVQAARRLADVRQYLEKRVLSVEERAAVEVAIAGDLRDLGISL